MSAGDETIILDAGTGIRDLGVSFTERNLRGATLLLTHTHWDHINGFPFFHPFYARGHRFRIMAGHLADRGGVRPVLAGQMAGPVFPVPMETLRAEFEFEDFRGGDSFELAPSIAVRTAVLNHPDGATGYRIDHAGHSVCYVTDTEHEPGKPDERILALIEGADLVIYDCTYTDAEFPEHAGWGHSTWQEGVRLCRAAHAKSLAIFHHDPSHDDEFMRQVEEEASALWEGASVARERVKIDLGRL